MKRKLSKRTRVVLWVVLGLAALIGISTVVYAAYFSSHGLPGASIAGVSVTGQTKQQVTQSLTERAGEVNVSVSIDGHSEQHSLAELGVKVDVDATVAKAFAANEQLGSRLVALVKKQDTPIVIDLDKVKTQAVVDGLLAKFATPAQNAKVALAEDGTTFAVTPGQSGTSVDASSVAAAAATAGEELNSQSVTLATSQVDPVTTTERAQAVAERANALVGLEVKITGRVDAHAAAPAEKAQWVTIPAPDDAPLGEPVFDQEKVTAWVNATSQATEVTAVSGIRNVDSAGAVVSTAKDGKDGWKVNNTAEVTQAALAALSAGESYSGTFTYDKVEPTYETRVVAQGSEKLVYQAAPDEKWIDLNMSNNTVTAYQGATVVRGPIYMVPGMPGMETPTGKFSVYLKYQSQTMRGTNLDGTKYVAPNIPWVTYFTGSIAFHGAPWRDSFGWSGPGGSHGCVNMPVDGAKFIYDWAPNGTVVISHY